MTTTIAGPPLRVLRPPAIDPPYDDESTATPVTEGSLALAFPSSGNALPLRLVPPALPADDGFGVTWTPRANLPDPRAWAGRLAQAVVEVLAGARPAAQLSRFASLEVLDHLERAVARLQRAGRGAPARRPVVRSVRVSEPSDGVAEACAVIDTGPRRRAIALRLEGADGRWQCTALQVG